MTKKKGFTIVELVIVIAVIAILAAVLIPTFTEMIAKAYYSNDIQLCKNMNTALNISKLLEKDKYKFDNVIDAQSCLKESKLVSTPPYLPKSSGMHYYWCLLDNTVYLVNDSEPDNFQFLFPEDLAADAKAKFDENQYNFYRLDKEYYRITSEIEGLTFSVNAVANDTPFEVIYNGDIPELEVNHGKVASKNGNIIILSALWTDNEGKVKISEKHEQPGIKFGNESYTVNKDSTKETSLIITNIDESTIRSTEYSSDNIDYVTVDKNGVLKYVAEGSAKITATVTLNDGTTYTAECTVNASCCFAAGTLVSMADGSTKKIEDIVVGDEVLTFNHLTGMFEAHPIYCTFEGETKDIYFELCFDDGTKVSLVHEHYLFEQESLKYVSIKYEDAEDFIGKHFYSANAGRYIELIDVIYHEDKTEFYTIYSEYNVNYFANGMLNVSEDVDCFVNFLKFNDDLTADLDQLEQDIAEFGLYEYPENADYSKEWFDKLDLKYMNILIGKGFGTWDDFDERRDDFFATYVNE